MAREWELCLKAEEEVMMTHYKDLCRIQAYRKYRAGFMVLQHHMPLHNTESTHCK